MHPYIFVYYNFKSSQHCYNEHWIVNNVYC